MYLDENSIRLARVAGRGPAVTGEGEPLKASTATAGALYSNVCDRPRSHASCGSGGIGRRAGLRNLSGQLGEGSSPSFRTSLRSLRELRLGKPLITSLRLGKPRIISLRLGKPRITSLRSLRELRLGKPLITSCRLDKPLTSLTFGSLATRAQPSARRAVGVPRSLSSTQRWFSRSVGPIDALSNTCAVPHITTRRTSTIQGITLQLQPLDRPPHRARIFFRLVSRQSFETATPR